MRLDLESAMFTHGQGLTLVVREMEVNRDGWCLMYLSRVQRSASKTMRRQYSSLHSHVLSIPIIDCRVVVRLLLWQRRSPKSVGAKVKLGAQILQWPWKSLMGLILVVHCFLFNHDPFTAT